MKKNVSLQILRIFSMFMIVICHLCSESGISIIVNMAQFFNVGVFIFLFISGYLYGKKSNINSKDFFYNRFKKLMLPFYIFLIYIIFLNILKNDFAFRYLFSNLFNLQYFFGSLSGMEHLWFMTELMICYLITPILYSLKKSSIIKRYTLIGLLLVLSILCVLFSNTLANAILYLCVYILGFYYTTNNNKYNLLKSVCLFCLAIIVRLVSKNYFDNTIFYNSYIVFATHTVISISLFNIFLSIFKNVKSNTLIDWFDSISFYVYICHYQFIYGPISVINNGNYINMFFSSFLSILLSFIFAVALKRISEFILKINRGEKNAF